MEQKWRGQRLRRKFRRVGSTEVKERDHFKKEGEVSVSDAAEGPNQVG